MATEEDDLLDDIEQSAMQPKRAQGDNGNSMEQFPLTEKIAADRYVRSKRAARSGLGIRFVKLIPPGSD